MSSTPKWYCRNKSTPPLQTFTEITKLGKELRRVTYRIAVDVKVDVFDEHNTLLEEVERVCELYWNLKDESQNKDIHSLNKKIKRSPYNALLLQKYNMLAEINDRRFCQLMFVLKQTVTQLLRKSKQSDMWLSWALQISCLYNKWCRRDRLKDADNIDGVCKEVDGAPSQAGEKKGPQTGEDGGTGEANAAECNANICSNMYPALLLPPKTIDFAYVLQHASQMRIEQNSLDLLFGLFNMSEQEQAEAAAAAAGTSSGAMLAAVPAPNASDLTAPAGTTAGENCESTASSLEILRILTFNMHGDNEFHCYNNGDNVGWDGGREKSNCRKYVEHFLQRERAYLSQLIAKANDYCPSIFGKSCTRAELSEFVMRGMRLIWPNVGLILDHIILWWIDTPLACYPLTHVETMRNWLKNHTEKDIPEPVYSTLRGVAESLTNFVANNIWDQLFRYTLLSTNCKPATMERALRLYRAVDQEEHLGTYTGGFWDLVFKNLIDLSNSYFPNCELQMQISSLPVAEQIPILHRIDHSVHSMRLWVKEQAKQLCCEWQMDRFFRILEHDVRVCLAGFSSHKLPKLTADLTDILMLVNVALRAKLILEINVNIDQLKKTNEECVQVLSEVCRILSLANFKLAFPPASHWQQRVFDEDVKSDYVDYVLDQIFLPAIKATKDLVILKLILKIICEAWLDYIYMKRIKFSVNGAVQLLGDFDCVREWILACSLLDTEQLEKLSNHEVLRMCKGVGKILLRKPEDVISIIQSPKFEYDRKAVGADAAAQETQLPSEMFVSNQKNWLQLRASKGNIFSWCCGDSAV
ncbi:uncharacterized protein LOC118743458 isoform X1 [Rhagoletis pomonella]|uniref:uncharacterized protein LOC118743458 isoform X1 n=1 Tax=Rhagoletis pomonella TaxID=28610 RepID=UPI001784198A|nr:uncharacterized protein LOC118743458 isoform X1 [Rhagoletis pomonella]